MFNFTANPNLTPTIIYPNVPAKCLNKNLATPISVILDEEDSVDGFVWSPMLARKNKRIDTRNLIDIFEAMFEKQREYCTPQNVDDMLELVLETSPCNALGCIFHETGICISRKTSIFPQIYEDLYEVAEGNIPPFDALSFNALFSLAIIPIANQAELRMPLKETEHVVTWLKGLSLNEPLI